MMQQLKMKLTMLLLPALLLAGEGFALLVNPRTRGGGRGRGRRWKKKKAALRKPNQKKKKAEEIEKGDFCPRVTGFETPEAAVKEFIRRNPGAEGKVGAFQLPHELLKQLQEVEAEYAQLARRGKTTPGKPMRDVQMISKGTAGFWERLAEVKAWLFAKMQQESSLIGGGSPSEMERVDKRMSSKDDLLRAQFLDSQVRGTPRKLDEVLGITDGEVVAGFLHQFREYADSTPGTGDWVGPSLQYAVNLETNANSFNVPQAWHQDGIQGGSKYLVLITVNTPAGLDTQKTGTWIGTNDLLSGSEPWISFPENGEQTGAAAAQEAVAPSESMNKRQDKKKIFGSAARPPLLAGDPELDRKAHYQLLRPYEVDDKPLSDSSTAGAQRPPEAGGVLPVDVKQKLVNTPSSCDPRMVLVPGPPGTVLVIRNYELAHAGPQIILEKEEWSYEEVREKCYDQQRRTLLRLNI
ncbi:unnamed protein product [Amoebophrya sp. A120]|nr:unnamed protein product [Amoebophrya sp. A120]|eukprot:GSA120T00008844001.1